MSLKPESGELRGMVRDVLREVMAARGSTESVRIASDADLAAFIARLTEPATLEAVRAGKLRFTLQGASAKGGALEGVITEKTLDRLAGASTLVLAPGAVLTPLARDKARKLGLEIERRS